jgi:GNAT superfamily N-acetyltransferase
MNIRRAQQDDIAGLQVLIEQSARALSAQDYTSQQIDSLIRYVYGVDSQLIADGTYFVIERDGVPRACGGWSKRGTLFGGDQAKGAFDPLLDPRTDAARIRAFFVHPSAARQGLGRRMLEACIAAARQAGFRKLELMATLPGERLYRALGFQALHAIEHEMPDGVRVRFVPMFMPIEA